MTADLKPEPQRRISDLIADLDAKGITPYKLVQILVMRGVKVQFIQIQRIMRGQQSCEHVLADAIRELHAAHSALENASRETS